MKIIGTGTDIVKLKRLEAALAGGGEDFLTTAFTAQEIDAFRAAGEPVAFLGRCWAAKEALVKALGCGFNDALSWSDLTFHDGQPPRLIYGKEVKKILRDRNGAELFISVSSCQHFAVATVIITDRQP